MLYPLPDVLEQNPNPFHSTQLNPCTSLSEHRPAASVTIGLTVVSGALVVSQLGWQNPQNSGHFSYAKVCARDDGSVQKLNFVNSAHLNDSLSVS